MAVKHVKDGFLGVYKHQQLRWLVKPYFAMGEREGRLELFEARAHKDASCGYQFKFLYEFHNIPDMQNVLPRLVNDTRDMKLEKWPKLIFCIQSLKMSSFLKHPPIDTSYTFKPSFWR